MDKKSIIKTRLEIFAFRLPFFIVWGLSILILCLFRDFYFSWKLVWKVGLGLCIKYLIPIFFILVFNTPEEIKKNKERLTYCSIYWSYIVYFVYFFYNPLYIRDIVDPLVSFLLTLFIAFSIQFSYTETIIMKSELNEYTKRYKQYEYYE